MQGTHCYHLLVIGSKRAAMGSWQLPIRAGQAGPHMQSSPGAGHRTEHDRQAERDRTDNGNSI